MGKTKNMTLIGTVGRLVYNHLGITDDPVTRKSRPSLFCTIKQGHNCLL